MNTYLQVYVSHDADREAVRDNITAVLVACAAKRLCSVLKNAPADPSVRQFLRTDGIIITDAAGPQCLFIKLHHCHSMSLSHKMFECYAYSFLCIPGVYSVAAVKGTLIDGGFSQISGSGSPLVALYIMAVRFVAVSFELHPMPRCRACSSRNVQSLFRLGLDRPR
jgi:hypothetical protein